MAKNYTLGRGELHFSRFKTGTEVPAGFKYFGNTPEFNLSIESEDLDHFSSDAGIREKDDSVVLEVTRTGSLSADDMQPNNIALFFFGDDSLVTTVASVGIAETFANIILGTSVKLGVSPSVPAGIFGIDGATFDMQPGGGGAAFVEGTDYSIDATNAMIEFLSGGTLADDTTVDMTYDTVASTRDRVISGSSPVEGALMYKAFNPKGLDYNYYMPKVKISPNGDLALKGDEWQQIPFTLEVLKATNQEAIYMDGNVVFT